MRAYPSLRIAAVLGVVALAPVPATASAAKGFSLGVGAFEVTSKSAILWAHPDRSGKFRLQVSTTKGFDKGYISPFLFAKASNDNTLQRQVNGLKPGKTYYYRFMSGTFDEDEEKSARGTFKTAPKASADKTIRFAFSGDADATRAEGESQIFYNALLGNNGLGAQNFGVYKQMALEKNHFNVNAGDTIYSDSEVPEKGALASTVAEKRERYRLNLAVKALQKMRGSAGGYNLFDDHEMVNDFTPPEHGMPIYQRGLKVYKEYMPTKTSPADGIYRRQRWGKNLEIFRIDGRSFRSAKASANGKCDNPETGSPDLAPTLPQDKRNLFALIVPSLAQPVSQECKDTINDPNRTLMGKHQFDRFVKDIKGSKAVFKAIIIPTPVQQHYEFPYDRMEGYEAERKKLLHALEDGGVKNTVFLATDHHANLVNVVRYETFPEDAPPVNSRYSEFVTGPVSTMTFRREIDQNVGAGNGNNVDSLFFDPPPPDGLGMPCSNIDVYSYAEVKVTSSKLAITAKDVAGKVVQDQSDETPCKLTIPKT